MQTGNQRLFKINIADSAQSKNNSIATRPLLFVRGQGLGRRLLHQ